MMLVAAKRKLKAERRDRYVGSTYEAEKKGEKRVRHVRRAELARKRARQAQRRARRAGR